MPISRVRSDRHQHDVHDADAAHQQAHRGHRAEQAGHAVVPDRVSAIWRVSITVEVVVVASASWRRSRSSRGSGLDRRSRRVLHRDHQVATSGCR
jgi:hypothetical protein